VSDSFWSLWYFQIPNYIVAVLMYSMIGRFILSFLFLPDSRNYIFRAFVRLTNPVVAVVRAITPLAVPPRIVLLFSVLWLLVLRFVLLALTLGAAAQQT